MRWPARRAPPGSRVLRRRLLQDARAICGALPLTKLRGGAGGGSGGAHRRRAYRCAGGAASGVCGASGAARRRCRPRRGRWRGAPRARPAGHTQPVTPPGQLGLSWLGPTHGGGITAARRGPRAARSRRGARAAQLARARAGRREAGAARCAPRQPPRAGRGLGGRRESGHEAGARRAPGSPPAAASLRAGRSASCGRGLAAAGAACRRGPPLQAAPRRRHLAMTALCTASRKSA
jgi:hypothetical protein